MMFSEFIADLQKMLDKNGDAPFFSRHYGYANFYYEEDPDSNIKFVRDEESGYYDENEEEYTQFYCID